MHSHRQAYLKTTELIGRLRTFSDRHGRGPEWLVAQTGPGAWLALAWKKKLTGMEGIRPGPARTGMACLLRSCLHPPFALLVPCLPLYLSFLPLPFSLFLLFYSILFYSLAFNPSLEP